MKFADRLQGLLEQVAEAAQQEQPHRGAGDVGDEEPGDRHARCPGEQAEVVVRRDRDDQVRGLLEPALRGPQHPAVHGGAALHPADAGVAVPAAEQVEERIGDRAGGGSRPGRRSTRSSSPLASTRLRLLELKAISSTGYLSTNDTRTVLARFAARNSTATMPMTTLRARRLGGPLGRRPGGSAGSAASAVSDIQRLLQHVGVGPTGARTLLRVSYRFAPATALDPVAPVRPGPRGHDGQPRVCGSSAGSTSASDQNAVVSARLAEPPAPLGELLDPDSRAADVARVANRRVTVTGTYEPDQQVLVRSRSLDGSPGSWVLTPLRPTTARSSS